MATLLPYCGTETSVGQELEVQVREEDAWRACGSGRFHTVGEFDLGFRGVLDARPLDIGVSLTDHDPGALEGPCSLRRGRRAPDDGRYVTVGDALVLTSQDGWSLTINQGGSETTVDTPTSSFRLVPLVDRDTDTPTPQGASDG